MRTSSARNRLNRAQVERERVFGFGYFKNYNLDDDLSLDDAYLEGQCEMIHNFGSMCTLLKRSPFQASASEGAGRFSNMNFPAFHSLFVNALFAFSLSMERFTSCTISNTEL